ncbi:tetratricopeptide repeat protein [Acidicapsa acidisoli]|uniref:tetratricopeptide repeat protein n=1 Tax=Acidicapsa acidisoli TaxID=1615681 RepID=UPI0021DFBA44|nr:tetratricopeptide repeat protein [Acidicapsa acidisoli]
MVLDVLWLGLWLVAATPGLVAQSAPPPSAPAPASGQQGNPFPADDSKAPAPESGAQKDSGAKPKAADNPFPGEDPNAPIIPVGPDSGAAGSRPGSGSGADAPTPRRDADPDGDPVRSPDGAAHTTDDDGFASSSSGLNRVPAPDDSDERPGKSTKNKTREQVIKEDVDVGGFYLDKKNWKAAQARFTSAFALDSENPDAVWGLAEAERHLQLYKEAAEHYKLLLSYDPDGPHHREARKALEEVETARPPVSASSKMTGSESSPPK